MSSASAAIIWQPLHTPRDERVGAREERGERSARGGAVEDALGPAGAGAEHVAVGEAADRDHAAEPREIEPGVELGHVHVDRLEAGAVEHGGHLDLRVAALLAQDRDPRPRPGPGAARGQGHRALDQPGVVAIGAQRVLLVGARRIVAQRLQAVRGVAPHRAQRVAIGGEHRGAVGGADVDAVAGASGADHPGPVREARAERGQDRRDLGGVEGQDHAGRLGEQHGERIVLVRKPDLEGGARRERQLEQRHDQAAVRAIVVAAQPTALGLDHRERLGQHVGVDVGGGVAELAVDLGQARAAEAQIEAVDRAELDRHQRDGAAPRARPRA
jgi:hypothetical protein